MSARSRDPASVPGQAGSSGNPDKDPVLLTPGPLTTTRATKAAMLRDWGSWDRAFNRLTASVCTDLLRIANGTGTHVCVPMQGSGTFSVEAALGTLVPRDGNVLVPNNGAYCQRIGRIMEKLGRSHRMLDFPEDRPVDPARIEEVLRDDETLTHVALVHCETGTGMLNPLAEVCEVARKLGRSMIVDAMSSFGALPIDVSALRIDALVSASGKCLEGVPGMGFVIARRAALEQAKGNAHSLALDLHDQWVYLERTGQWRYTPPTHVVAALRAALDQYLEQGGQPARLRRYRDNCAALVAGMEALGVKPFLPARDQAPIIVTFHAAAIPGYSFAVLYEAVREQGFILYPGKLTQIETFRVGCIGAIGTEEIRLAVAAIGSALGKMAKSVAH
jgi:2-aminoethylphosphonate-pyruvate transaminase